ncbi:hypothetical protein FRC06_004703, partial [Ceratobasidium sp. 370]
MQAATATPQRAGTTTTKDTTPSSGIAAAWTASPQTPTTFAYGGPARASSSVLPSPPKDDSSPQSRSRWTEHIENTIVEDEGGDGDGGEDEDPTARVGLPLPPAAAASLARMQRSSLPMPFELTDPADHDHDQDDTVRPGLGRVATTRSVRIMQPAPAAQSPSYLQVPRQPYIAPESRGTTPMPIRPTSQLGLVTYGGRVRSPRFNAPSFDLKLTREPGIWARIQWRIGLPLLVFGPIVVQLFFDFCAVYTVVQVAAEPTFGATSSRRNWSLAAAAYCACVLIWVVGVLIIYQAVYLFWRRWRVKRPLITPIYLSTPARHLASMASFDVFCFFRYVQRSAWDADTHDYVYDERVMGREGAEGRAGNRSKEMLGGHSREMSGGRSAAQSSDMLGREKEHRRSDSGGMLMQPRDSEDWRDDAGRASALGGRESGMRRRSVGRNGGDEVRASLQIQSSDPSPTSPTTDTGGNGKGHKRTASGQTRFQELVNGPSHPNSLRGKKGQFVHRRSMSGRTSSEVERQLDISLGPLESRRVSGSSGSSAAVGRVVSWVRTFGHGQHVHPHAHSEKRDTQSEGSDYSDASGRWTTDGLAEWFYARTQGAPTVATLIPRAGICAAALFSFWEPQAIGAVSGGAGVGGMRDGAFFRSNGTLTGFARGVLLANVAWVLARALLVLFSLLGLWILSGQMCAGMCGPRYRWEEPLDEGEWDGEKDEAWGEPRDKLNWEWRIAARRRVQDAYELCMVRRRSTSWRAPPPAPPSQPPTPAPRIEGLDKGKGKGRETPRPGMDTFGSTFGAEVVRERNSDQELALSGLKQEGGRVPVLEVTEHESDAAGGNGGSRRGILAAEMTGPGGRRQPSVLSHDDSILSHNQDSIISHLPRSPTSTISRAHDSIISRVQDDSLISSRSPSVRSGLIPPPPPNPNRRRRMTAPSGASSSVDSFGVVRRRVGSHTFGPVEFGAPAPDVEGFEAEQEDSVGMLSTPSSRKNSLAAVSQRGGRRGRVSSGSQSGSQSGSGSARSRAVSANYSVSLSGSGSGSGGSVARRSHSAHGEEEERDYTLGHRPMWRRGSAQLQPREEGTEETPSTAAQPSAPVAGPSNAPADEARHDPEPEQR